MSAIKPFVIDFDPQSGECLGNALRPETRRVSDMASMFSDTAAAEALVRAGDPSVYRFYSIDLPEDPGMQTFGMTTLYPGKVGGEYFMTKGHFHTILDTAEAYYCISGHGCMMMETPEGEVSCKEFRAGSAIYVPGRWSHRSINTGTEPLIFFFVFRADAGHDYGSIEEKGYRRLLVERDGKPTLIDNPRWRRG
jgi:glucose-6-phosphate isomerase